MTIDARGNSLDLASFRFAERPAAGRLNQGDEPMSKERVEGAVQKGVGSAKQAAGKAVGSEKLQAEGLADKAAGRAKEAVGKAKDAAHKATK